MIVIALCIKHLKVSLFVNIPISINKASVNYHTAKKLKERYHNSDNALLIMRYCVFA